MTTAATDFLRSLWTEQPPGLLPVWRLKGKTLQCFADADAAGVSLNGQTDAYIATITVNERLPKTTRPTLRHAAAIAGLWLDLDVNGGPKHNTGVAPDQAAALDLANAIEPPTLIVSSGYGLHAWWLFDKPWLLHSQPERDAAQLLVWQWYAIHRKNANKAGWTIDHTHDLGRLLRPPGTFNGKGDQNVSVDIVHQGGTRYSVGQLAEHAKTAGPMTTAAATSIFDGPLAVAGDINEQLFDDLMAASPDFARTWRHQRTEHPSWSLSEYDLALCSIATKHGWKPDDLAALIHYHRRTHGDTKGQRADYVHRTIGKATTCAPAAAALASEPASHPATPVAQPKPARSNTFTAQQWADHIAEMLERPEEDTIATPFDALTEAMDGGFRAGEVVLVAAYTSHGKSIIVDQIADTAADAGSNVHIYMTEMTAYQRGLRLLARQTSVSFRSLKRKEIHPDDWGKIYAALNDLKYGVSIVSDWTVEQVVAHIRANKWDLCVVDLIHGFHYTDERDLSKTSSAIVQAAKGSATADFAGTVIVCAAHLNDGQMRDQKKPQRPKPGLHSIKGASSLKQDADAVWFIWQEDDEQGLPTGEGSLWIAKNRQGGFGAVAVDLDTRRMVFRETA